MRNSKYPASIFVAAAIALGCTFLLVTVDSTAQVRVQIAQPAPPIEAGEQPQGTREIHEKLSYPEDRDTSQKFEAVTDYLGAAKPDWPVVVKLAQGLLDAKSDYFYQYNANSTNPKADKRRVSVKDEMNRLIGKFNKDGRDFYQLAYGPIADGILKDARQNGLDIARLTEVSQRYFHTKAGAEAALLLASLNLELGNYPEAAYGFQRLLLRPETDALLDAKTLFKAVVAFKRANDGRIPEAAAGIWDTIEKKLPRDGVRIGNRFYTLDEMKVEANRPTEFLFGKVGDAYVSMHRGNATRASVADASPPFLDPVFYNQIIFHTEHNSGVDWLTQNINTAYQQTKNDRKKVLIPAGFPVTAPNRIIYRGYDGTYAFYSKDTIDSSGHNRSAGELAWFATTRGGAQNLFTKENVFARNEAGAAESAWKSWWFSKMPSILFENSLLGSISHDGKLAYFIDDLAVLPPPTNNFGVDPWGGGGLGMQPGAADSTKSMKDYNQLIAVDVESGLLAWSLGGIGPQLKSEEEDRVTVSSTLTENSYFLGPPLPLNGKLYVLFERMGTLRLACLDPGKLVKVADTTPGFAPSLKPELLWVQNLGKTNTTLKQDPLRRIQGAFLASAEGVIICPTNIGAIIAVDINARSLLWAHTYSTIDKSMSEQPNIIGRRPIPVNMNMPIPENRWRSSTPIISNGRVIMSAYDCDQLQCLDLRTGKLLWTEPRKMDDLYVGGISGNKILIVGKSTVRAVQVTGEKEDRKAVPAWKDEVKIGTPCGHGVMSKDGLYFLPVVGDPDNKDSTLQSVWAVNVDTGNIVSKTAFRPKKELGRPAEAGGDSKPILGNLVFHDGLMFSQSATEFNAFPLIEVKKREMNLLLAKNPNDPDGLTSRGELSLDEGKLAEAIADFKKAQGNKPSEATERKIKQKLYFAYTEVLRNKFEDGEKYLEEYKTLCELPSDPLEEQNRRKGLYYSIVAKGREGQGKLVDAFDHYRAFALLGEQKQLVPAPDDVHTMTRSDVWARCRIEAMIRNAKDPAARKPLEDRIEKEWQGIRTANDLARLRDFVKVFGSTFNTGREAQLLLAETLLQTSIDADNREAQAILFSLWGSNEGDEGDRTYAARSVDLLARAMVRRGMMEDSVGLYNILGTRFTDVVVRDGKTGGEIYGELVTDKRYLPFLEPTRGVGLVNYKVEPVQSNAGVNRVNTYSIHPEGALLPFFKRFRITLESDPNAGYIKSSLRVTDRNTGEERCKFTELFNLQTINGYPVTASRYKPAQVAGHMLMIHAGQNIHCYDLSEKNGKELWKINLLGANDNTANIQWTSENLPDGDLAVGPAMGDNWRFRMGMSSVLQPAYASVLTRDGLITVDPKNGTKLWTRANISAKALIVGDAKYIYLVESSTTGTTSRVLNALDGTQVEGVKEFGSLVMSGNRLQLFGRQVLVRETTVKDRLRLHLYDIIDGKDVWSKEFPDGSRVIKSLDPETIGVLGTGGKIELFAARTGKPIITGQVAQHRLAEHLEDNGKFAVTNPIMIADAERYYVFLSRPADNQGQVNWWGYQFIKTLSVSGPCYCYDRGTGKLLWYSDEHFKDQQIMLERFDELPVIVAANHNNNNNKLNANANPNRFGAQQYQVVVVDKINGMRKYMASHPPGTHFQSVWQDKNGAVEFWQWNFRLRISPEENKK